MAFLGLPVAISSGNTVVSSEATPALPPTYGRLPHEDVSAMLAGPSAARI